MKYAKHLYLPVTFVLLFALPQVGFCSVESTLGAIQSRLVGTVLPLAAILGLVFAGFSFIMGSPNARTHLMLAIIGAAVGFGAESIMRFIQQLVH